MAARDSITEAFPVRILDADRFIGQNHGMHKEEMVKLLGKTKANNRGKQQIKMRNRFAVPCRDLADIETSLGQR